MQDNPTLSTAKAGRTTSQSLIQSITPRGGEALEVGTVTALLGPHNAGKTETLRDVLRLAANYDLLATDRSRDEEPRTTVLSDLTFVPKLSLERMLNGLTVIDSEAPEGTVVQGIGPNLKTPYRRVISKDLVNILSRPVMTARSVWMTSLGDLMLLRASYLGPDDRRRLVEPTVAASPTQGPENLLQILHYAEPSVHEALDAAFNAAFPGLHIKLDASQRVNLTLRVAPTFPAESDDAIANVRQYQALPNIADEGDAYQSFAAVVLTILLGAGRMIVLDQPEAFLRPHQARLLGRWIADHAPRLACQVFLATSDAALLQGLTEGQADLALIRLQREETITRFCSIPPDAAKGLAQFPLFASQNAMALLFRDGVVIAPREGDRVVYETVATRFAAPHNWGFIQAMGMLNIPFVADVLRKCGVPLCAIIELEAFRSETLFTDLVTATTGAPPPQPWLATRERLVSHVEGWFDEDALSADAHEVESFLEEIRNGDAATKTETRELTAADVARNWEKLRHERLEWLPREMRIWVEELIEDLRRNGIFVSPKGRLQAWIELGVEERTLWVNKAMQLLHQGQCPTELQAFVSDLTLYLQSRAAPARITRLSNHAGSTTAG